MNKDGDDFSLKLTGDNMTLRFKQGVREIQHVTENIADRQLRQWNRGQIQVPMDVRQFVSNNKVTVIIPSSVVKIVAGAFSGTHIEEVIFERRMQPIEISERAFWNCSELKSINLRKLKMKDDTLSAGSFGMCRRLETVVLPERLRTIESAAFVTCQMLDNVTVPEGVVEIGHRAFDGTLSLTKLKLPDSLQKIGPFCFNSSTARINYGPPNTFEVITPRPLHIEMGDGVTEFGRDCFKRVVLLGSRNEDLEVQLDMGTLTKGNEGFPNSSPELITCKRIAKMEELVGSAENGTCFVEKVFEVGQRIPQTIRVIDCKGVKVPIVFTNLGGDEWKVKVNHVKDMNTDIKLLAFKQHKEIPTINQWEMFLHTGDVLDTLPLRELMTMAITGNIALSEPIQIVYKSPERIEPLIPMCGVTGRPCDIPSALMLPGTPSPSPQQSMVPVQYVTMASPGDPIRTPVVQRVLPTVTVVSKTPSPIEYHTDDDELLGGKRRRRTRKRRRRKRTRKGRTRRKRNRTRRHKK